MYPFIKITVSFINPNCLDYKAWLLACNLLPLTIRREIIDPIIFLKSLNASNGYDCTKYIKFQVAREGVTTRNQNIGLTIKSILHRYSASAQFFPFRISKLWNSLPILIRQKLIGLDDKDKIKRVHNTKLTSMALIQRTHAPGYMHASALDAPEPYWTKCWGW